MHAAEALTDERAALLPWTELCEQCPDEWVCLLDVEDSPDGSIRAARLICHDRSMRRVLAHLGGLPPNAVLLHTSGRPFQSPRTGLTDEIRDIVRPRR